MDARGNDRGTVSDWPAEPVEAEAEAETGRLNDGPVLGILLGIPTVVVEGEVVAAEGKEVAVEFEE